MDPIYLDYNATTPLDPLVSAEMMPFLGCGFGNPSSIHTFGRIAGQAVMEARRRIAALLHCAPDEIVFTSGGTESNNFAIKGAALANQSRGKHILTSAIEHPAVTEVCRHLQTLGFEITWIRVDGFGLVNPEEVRWAIRPDTILITIMHANNETGSIQPVSEIGRIAKENGILFHTDAAQSVGKIPVDVRELGVDLLSVAGHKMYAPKGVGALYIRRGVSLEKLIHGASQEAGRRAGTENVIEIVGFGKAAELACNWQLAVGSWQLAVTSHQSPVTCHQLQLQFLCDKLFEGIRQAIPEVRLNGHPELRLPNTLSLGFPGVEANLLLNAMPEIAASAGAACHAGEKNISGVLAAMHVPMEYAMGTIRFSVGRMTTEEEIEKAIPIIVKAYRDHQSPVTSHQSPASGIRLTEYTRALGCSCKIRPQTLEKILKKLPPIRDPRVIVGPETSDDASVFQVNPHLALVQTVDVIPPVVDDPYYYGAIAAANAISDIYAMGGEPLYALNIVGFPESRLPLETLEVILKGASDKAAEAGIQILGGHSIETTEPLFGLTVTGSVHPGKVIRNRGLQPGDALVLTKPLGTGILSLALKRGFLSAAEKEEIYNSMASLNRTAAEKMIRFTVHACTDVTGFGLLGHLKEMIGDDPIDVEIDATAIPVFEHVWEYLAAGLIPGATRNNLEFVNPAVTWVDPLSESEKLILCDAQTSGGLLIGLPRSEAESLVNRLRKSGIKSTSLIGTCIPGKGKIRVQKQTMGS
ncbi:MAG: selenide, water dikinase SelD [bacterium]